MLALLKIATAGPGAPLRHRVIAIYTLLAVLNAAVWLWALALFHTQPLLLGTALLAYSLGLRHAVDADHIAAIDNVTRKLMQDGQRPVSAGFFFAIGHSTVVILAAIAIALTATAVSEQFEAIKTVGAVLGTAISTLFLFIIAALNLVTLLGIWRALRRVKRGEAVSDSAIESLQLGGGLLARLFRPLFGMIGQSWHMLPLGFLFGLGFDTATEVGLLSIAAAESAKGISLWAILVFPALFTAGMALIDTTDGVLMLGAYRWAFINPARKLTYNLVVTTVSVTVAVVIAGVEALGLIHDQFGMEGGFWDAVDAVNGDTAFTAIGIGVISLFMLAWIVAVVVYRYAGTRSGQTGAPSP